MYILQNAIEKAVDKRYELLNIEEFMQIDVFCCCCYC